MYTDDPVPIDNIDRCKCILSTPSSYLSLSWEKKNLLRIIDRNLWGFVLLMSELKLNSMSSIEGPVTCPGTTKGREYGLLIRYTKHPSPAEELHHKITGQWKFTGCEDYKNCSCIFNHYNQRTNYKGKQQQQCTMVNLDEIVHNTFVNFGNGLETALCMMSVAAYYFEGNFMMLNYDSDSMLSIWNDEYMEPILDNVRRKETHLNKRKLNLEKEIQRTVKTMR